MLLEFSETGVELLSQEWGWLDIIRMLVSTFLAAIYLQSGIDKIVDRQGNLDFMGEHFSETILTGSFHYGLTTVTELLAGALSATGVVWLLLGWGGARNGRRAFRWNLVVHPDDRAATGKGLRRRRGAGALLPNRHNRALHLPDVGSEATDGCYVIGRARAGETYSNE
ncbi:MAG TPA: hypothetical protein QF608_03675 [Candidatus Poseidoniia archaeon]|nr:hypothetical protein [Candidatus Poseidoniia archaeon]